MSIAFLDRLLKDESNLRTDAVARNKVDLYLSGDNNVAPGASALALMRRADYMIPVASALLGQQILISEIKASFKFADLIDPSRQVTQLSDSSIIDAGVTRGYSFPLSFLYYNGAVTLDVAPSAGISWNAWIAGEASFKIPNEVIRAEFIESLCGFFSLKSPAVVDFVNDWSAKGLQSLFSHFLNNQEARNLFCSNRIGEDILRDFIYLRLQFVMSMRKETWLTPARFDGKRCDFLLMAPGNIVIIVESKRIHHNALVIDGLTDKVDYTADEFDRVEEIIDAFDDDAIRDVLIRERFGYGCKSVSEIVKKAIKQVQGYLVAAQGIAELQGKKIKGFVTVQVGWRRILMEEVVLEIFT
jgi:hypothetical protein